jgi:DNA-binding NarL/FixJ family response regulator
LGAAVHAHQGGGRQPAEQARHGARDLDDQAVAVRGMTNPEIAAQLFLSNHTIKTHISRIFAKTGSRDRAAAIGYAHRHNIG